MAAVSKSCVKSHWSLANLDFPAIGSLCDKLLANDEIQDGRLEGGR